MKTVEERLLALEHIIIHKRVNSAAWNKERVARLERVVLAICQYLRNTTFQMFDTSRDSEAIMAKKEDLLMDIEAIRKEVKP